MTQGERDDAHRSGDEKSTDKRDPKDAQPPITGWRKALSELDGPLTFIKNLSLFSLVAVIATAFFQFNQWSIDKTLDRAKSDYALATQTFDELIGTLAKAQNLQQIVYFLYKAAANAPQDQAVYFHKQAQNVAIEYAKIRMELRTGIDRLFYKAQLYIDWASDLDDNRTLASTRYSFAPVGSNVAPSGAKADTLSDAKLDGAGFKCTDKKAVPDYVVFTDLKPVPMGPIIVDWRSAKHQLVIFYHCFDELHQAILPARIWAATDPATPGTGQPSKTAATALAGPVEAAMDNQVIRINGLSMLVMTRIEQIRRLNALPSFFDYYLRNRDRIVTQPG
ncbi:hypothetical protein GGQ86_003285 [Xanthobacter flavus]|uniref:Uncharacterized protein n=1 Tax=Xanthobacter flavus TaxID=281 RepID=A0A9W6FKD3_XANFL|nr:MULTISPECIES: hypothetical protein [Xanthobacter]MBN8916020.1 hypothetical protein [Hyphomicrobiales bacterium]MDR6334803.1 hypothetical protein [Xanthobacter flavus]NMN57143.1 hypothetical protein [Xanthobacter sp. SG618]GLI23175.1 hypothetical protein XFLAVUS301_28490 [Xanthobacter flavus]